MTEAEFQDAMAHTRKQAERVFDLIEHCREWDPFEAAMAMQQAAEQLALFSHGKHTGVTLDELLAALREAAEEEYAALTQAYHDSLPKA